MNDILSSSEFWTGFAFVLVVGLFMRPLLRGMSKWTDKRVNLIQKEQNEAREVLKKAEEMKKKYEKAYLNRFSEKQQMMQEADKWLQPTYIVLGHANAPTVTELYPWLLELLASRGIQTVTLNDVYRR